MRQENQSIATTQRHRPHVREPEKTSRAFAAYVDLMDTADWLRDKMSRQLETWNLTMMQFRVMETIYRNGPQYQQELSRKFQCSKQNVGHVIKSLVGCRCLRREVSNLPLTPSTRWANPGRGPRMKRAPHGRRINLVRLTAEGERLIAYVFPRHRKVVKAEMRALEGREQETLSRLCRKLKEGDIVKFFKEIRMKEADEKPWGMTG